MPVISKDGYEIKTETKISKIKTTGTDEVKIKKQTLSSNDKIKNNLLMGVIQQRLKSRMIL